MKNYEKKKTYDGKKKRKWVSKKEKGVSGLKIGGKIIKCKLGGAAARSTVSCVGKRLIAYFLICLSCFMYL